MKKSTDHHRIVYRIHIRFKPNLQARLCIHANSVLCQVKVSAARNPKCSLTGSIRIAYHVDVKKARW